MTYSVDFDGVIHAYSKGWHNGKIYDAEVPDVFYSLDLMMMRDSVFVLTTRDPRKVARWIEENSWKWIENSAYRWLDTPGIRGITCTTRRPRNWYGRRLPFWNKRGILLVTNYKYPAKVYIDDRGYCFKDWAQTLEDLGFADHYLSGRNLHDRPE